MQWCVLGLILLTNVLLKAPNLGHPSLKPMDESFHAVVARNLMYDPFKPTLIREPYLPYDPTDWLSNHVWLHKPVLPLWIIALSFKIFGVSTLALRLPSLLLCTGAILWTFMIARKLYGDIPALIASAIQAIVPTIGMIVHGYVFSDAIDINLLFWSELSLVLMLYAPSRKYIVLSGCAAGAAFMSKTFPALFTIAPLCLLVAIKRITIKDAMFWITAFLMIAAPWNIYCAIRFPTEFKAEFGLILSHVSENVENWASPWDRLWFQHLPSALYHFWTISLVGSIVLTIRAIQLRRWEWLFVPVWIASVLIPFTLATSKTPSATLIAWPALMIGAGFLISRAFQGYVVELATTITLLIAMIFFRGQLITKGWGLSEPFAVAREAQWIAWHIAIALTVTGASLAWDKRLKDTSRFVLALAVAIGLGWLGWGALRIATKVWAMDGNQTSFAETGRWIQRNLPRNAVIIADTLHPQNLHYVQNIHPHFNELGFYSGRTVYRVVRTFGEEYEIRRIKSAHGEVYLLDELNVLYSESSAVNNPIFVSKEDEVELRKAR